MVNKSFTHKKNDRRTGSQTDGRADPILYFPPSVKAEDKIISNIVVFIWVEHLFIYFII